MEVTYLIQSFANSFLDTFFLLVTKLSETEVLVFIIGVTYWCTDNKFGRPYFAAISFNMGMNAMLKNIFRIPRIFNSDYPKVRVVDAAVKTATGYSFPSGHTQFATVVYGVIGTYKKGIIRIACYLIILLVGISRIYLGVHTVYDVIFAFAVGIISSLLCMKYFEKLIKINPWIAMVFAIPALLGIVFVDPGADGDTFQTAGMVTGVFLGIVIDEKYINFDYRASFKNQILKVAIGLAVALALHKGLKIVTYLIASDGTCFIWFLTFARYFLIGLWITAGFPALSKKMFKLNADVKI